MHVQPVRALAVCFRQLANDGQDRCAKLVSQFFRRTEPIIEDVEYVNDAHTDARPGCTTYEGHPKQSWRYGLVFRNRITDNRNLNVGLICLDVNVV